MKSIIIILVLSISVSSQNLLKETEKLPLTKFDSVENLSLHSRAATFTNQQPNQNLTVSEILENRVDSIVYRTVDDQQFKFINEYDSENRIIRQTSYNWINNKWSGANRNTIEYDEFGNVTLDLNEKYANSNWVYVDKETAAFDGHNNLLFKKRYEWSGHGWNIQTLYEWIYNDFGNILSSRFVQGISGENQKYEHFYDELQRDTLTIRYEWFTDQYIFTNKWTNYYNDDYYSVINKHYIWINESWDIEYISKQVLDNEDNFLEEKFERWSNGSVEASFLHLSEYDEQGNRLSKKSYEMKDGSLELYFEAEYQYDVNGHQIFWTFKHYEDKLLIDADRYTRTYDDSVETSTIYEKWDGATWKLISSTFYNYNAQGKLLIFRNEHLDVVTNQTYIMETNYNYNVRGNPISVISDIKEGNYFNEKRKTELSYDSNDKLITVMNYKLAEGEFIENDDYYYYSSEILGSIINMSYSELYIYHNNGDPLVRNDQKSVPQYKLFQNFPNPFNPETIISFSVSKQSEVRIVLYNSIGQEVEKIISDVYMPGTYYIPFKKPALSSGIYFYRLETDNNIITKKMIILK